MALFACRVGSFARTPACGKQTDRLADGRTDSRSIIYRASTLRLPICADIASVWSGLLLALRRKCWTLVDDYKSSPVPRTTDGGVCLPWERVSRRHIDDLRPLSDSALTSLMAEETIIVIHTNADRQSVDISVTVCNFVCVFVRLRISPPRIKLAASDFARRFIGVQGRESHIFVNFAPQSPKSDESVSAWHWTCPAKRPTN